MFNRKKNDERIVIPSNCQNLKKKSCELQCTIEEKFRRPHIMLHLTGLCFEDDRPFWRYLKFIRAMILFLLVTYQAAYILIHLIKKGTYDQSTTFSLVILNWHFQAVISMAFLIYWQFRGYLKSLSENVHCPKGCPRTVHIMNRTLIIYTIMYSIIIVAGIVQIVLTSSTNYLDNNEMIDWELLKMYDFWILEKLRFCMIVYIYSFYAWMTVLTCFILLVRALQNEFEYFNWKLAKIGLENPDDKEKIAEELATFFMGHVDLTNRIRAVDKIFEVYTFSMLGSNIPTTIFCLLNLFAVIKNTNSTFVCIGLSLLELGYCFIELIGLTSAPAKIHEVIRNVESIIYGNSRIWMPYNDKVYQLASVFIAHANQYNLGITLWGFAVVTKPLILTTISLTVTYLTFIMQVKYDGSDNISLNNRTIVH